MDTELRILHQVLTTSVKDTAPAGAACAKLLFREEQHLTISLIPKKPISSPAGAGVKFGRFQQSPCATRPHSKEPPLQEWELILKKWAQPLLENKVAKGHQIKSTKF